MALAFVPGAVALDAPATTQDHDGDLCIHQPRPDPHQVPCLITVWFSGDSTEVCVALTIAFGGIEECVTFARADGDTYDVCVTPPSPDPHKEPERCYASVWVPDVAPLCFYTSPDSPPVCLS